MEEASRILDQWSQAFAESLAACDVSGSSSGSSSCPITQAVLTHLLAKYDADYLANYKDEAVSVLLRFAPLGEEAKWTQMGRITDAAFLSFCETCWCLEKLKLVEFITTFVPRLLVCFDVAAGTKI